MRKFMHQTTIMKTSLLLCSSNERFTEWLAGHLCGKQFRVSVSGTNSWPEPQLRETAVALIYLDPMRQFESGAIRLLRQCGYMKPLLGWLPGHAINTEHVFRLLNAGLEGIVTPDYSADEIALAFQEVVDSGMHLNELVGSALVRQCKRRNLLRETFGPPEEFDNRECEAVRMRKNGKTAQEIGDALCLSKKSIDKLFWNLYKRFGCRNFFELWTLFEKSQMTDFIMIPAEEGPTLFRR